MKKFLLGLILGGVIFAPAFVYSASAIADRLKGRILLQVEENGEAWFVSDKGERIYMGTPQSAFEILRKYALGISNKDLADIPLADNAYSLNNEIKQVLGEKIVYRDRVVEKIVEKPVYIDRYVDRMVEKQCEPLASAPAVVPTPTLSIVRDGGFLAKATGDDFIIEVISVSSPKKLGALEMTESVRRGQTVQLWECAMLTNNWLESSGISYPYECASQGYFQTDWNGRKRTDAFKILQNREVWFGIGDSTDGDKYNSTNTIINYIRAVGVNTGTVITLRNI